MNPRFLGCLVFFGISGKGFSFLFDFSVNSWNEPPICGNSGGFSDFFFLFKVRE